MDARLAGWDGYGGGRRAAAAIAPGAVVALDALAVAAWAEAGPALATLAADACAHQLGIAPFTPQGWAPATGAGPGDVVLSDEARRAAVAFAEQYSADVSQVDAALRGAVVAGLGASTGPFLQAVYAADVFPRAWLLLDRLFGPSAARDGDPADGDLVEPVPYREAFETMLRVIAKLDALDAVTTELVRLRGARQHNCRICKSRRSRTAIHAGADDATFAAVDDYEASALPERAKTALRLADAFIWTPGRVPGSVVREVRAAFTPAEAVEIVLDLARNAANKSAVAFGADAAVVEDGVELYEIDELGDVVAGSALR